MTIHIDTYKKRGLWQFAISAGEDGDLEKYASSEYEYDTEYDAENNAIIWLMYERNIME